MRATLERELHARRDLVARSPVLGRLAARLRGHLDGLIEGPPYLPEQKALLSRDGGVCPVDGARLAFDPTQPDRHRCARCGGAYTGERHHRAWVTRYQLWLSERTIHLALLATMTGDTALATRAGEVLATIGARYRSYPNVDNVLGPSRLFFSTYLESIWLVQVSLAAVVLEVAAPEAIGPADRRVVRSMIRDSAELIAEFDEGTSNRQVWNHGALLAAGAYLGDAASVDRASRRLARQLDAVGDDGMWHEGENYHLFALRGFLLAAEWLRWGGTDLYGKTRLGEMYVAPLDTLLPDLTLPARGDAPYGVSIRQPRFAELWEIGRARTGDARLSAILAELYADGVAEGEDAGHAELAEQEQNQPPHRQHRDRLGWKAMLWMDPEPPEAGSWSVGGRLLARHGLAVLRPGAGRYVSVECGRRTGGHGHPDGLHLSLVWDRALLADFGTGSYVAPSLHWYRSTRAHNAPALAGRDQERGPAWCAAFDQREGWSWCRAALRDPFGPGTAATRSVIAGPDFVLDLLDVDAPEDTAIELPVHSLGSVGVDTVADGDRRRVVTPPGPLAVRVDGASVGTLQLVPRDGELLFVEEAPGPPGPDLADGPTLPYLVRHARGPGRWIALYCAGVPPAVEVTGDVLRVRHGDRSVRVQPTAAEVAIETDDGRVVLSGRRPPPAEPRRPFTRRPTPLTVPLIDVVPSLDRVPLRALRFVLAGDHYRRSERPYAGADAFSARVDVAAHDDALVFAIDVAKRDVIVRAVDAPDPMLDNEIPDIHSDGVQVYVGRTTWQGYVVLPEFPRGGIRVRPVAGTAGRSDRVRGDARAGDSGYRVVVACHTGRVLRPGDRVRFNVVVNEMRPGRDRRAGQLTLTGGGWVYLRGDREPEGEALEAVIG